MKKSLLVCFGVSSLLLAGCGDSEVAPPPAPAPVAVPADLGASTTPIAPVAAPPPEAAAPGAPAPAGAAAPEAAKKVSGVLEGANAYSMADLVNLNNAYQAFRSVEMRSPRDLNELVTSKQIDALPPAPGGKKFVIDEPNLRVILVNQ